MYNVRVYIVDKLLSENVCNFRDMLHIVINADERIVFDDWVVLKYKPSLVIWVRECGI